MSLSYACEFVVEAEGLEPPTTLRAKQVLSQLSCAPVESAEGGGVEPHAIAPTVFDTVLPPTGGALQGGPAAGRGGLEPPTCGFGIRRSTS